MENLNFYIILFSILLVGVLVTFYCTYRINGLEQSLVKQNRILSDLISDFKNNMSPNVTNAGIERIDVSENGSDELDSEESDSEESHTTLDEDEYPVRQVPIEILDNITEINEKVTGVETSDEDDDDIIEDVDIEESSNGTELDNSDITSHQDTSNNIVENNTFEDISNVVLNANSSGGTDVSENVLTLDDATRTDEEIRANTDPDNSQPPLVKALSLGSLSSTDEVDTVLNQDFSKMKVGELRELALKNNLDEEEEIKKMKKKDLVTLVSNN